MKRLSSISIAGYLCLLLTLLVSCKKDDVRPTAVSGNYFPLTTGLQWQYLITRPYSTSASAPIQKIVGDTLIGNQTYTIVRSEVNLTNDTVQSDTRDVFVRRENGDYIEASVFNYSDGERQVSERIFLIDYLRVGDQWENLQRIEGAQYRQVMTIKAIDKERTIKGQTSFNTIEVQEDTYVKLSSGEEESFFESRHSVYAKDVGMVYQTTEWFGYRGYQEKALKSGPL